MPNSNLFRHCRYDLCSYGVVYTDGHNLCWIDDAGMSCYEKDVSRLASATLDRLTTLVIAAMLQNCDDADRARLLICIGFKKKKGNG